MNRDIIQGHHKQITAKVKSAQWGRRTGGQIEVSVRIRQGFDVAGGVAGQGIEHYHERHED